MGDGDGGFVKLQGAGASFPAPLYASWFKKYSQEHENVQIDYQSVGSGTGVNMIMEETVDFGASDAAMQPEEIEEVERGVQLLPMTAGSVVLAYNLEGVTDLKLSREAYTSIFLGKVTKWNDPLIAACNEGVTLPDRDINVIVRSDSSGTTFVFTKHLSAVSGEFAESPGTHKKPNWPVGVGGRGNEGVTQTLATTPGSIGYIEFGYAIKSNLNMVTLENKAGNYIKPSIQSARAALAAIEMPEDLIAWAPDPAGAESYPIVTYTWLLCYKEYEDSRKAEILKDVIEFCLADEQQHDSESLGYIPLPSSVVEKVRAAMTNIGS
ncbi:MAG: phosphate ABC transporter substrate-binding protein PstS [Planctomycetota bacterium]